MSAGQLVASLYGVLSLQDKMTPGLKQAESNLNSFAGNTGAATQKVQALVSAMKAVPAVGFLAAAVGQAAQFEKSMTNIGAVMGKTKDQMSGLSKEVLDIGRNSVAGPQAVAESFYDIVGGVADASTHMAILKASTATAEAGNANLQATTQGLISVMNSYNYSAGKASNVSDILTQTVGKGVGTMDQFVGAIGPISGTSAAAGVGFQEMASSLAYMTTRGTSAAQSATQFKAATVALLNPNVQMAAALKKLGVASGSALIQQYGLVGALNMLKKAGGGSMDAMAKMLGSVEALSAATALTGSDFKKFTDGFSEGLNGATEAARKIQLTSLSAQFDIFKSNLTAVAIAAGNVLLPPLTALFSIINALIGIVNAFDPNLLGLVAAFTALGIAIPALLPLLGAIASAIAPILIPIAALTGAFVAVKAAWETDFGGIRTTITGFWNDIQPTLATIKGGIDTFFAVFNEKGNTFLDLSGLDTASARFTRKMAKLNEGDGMTTETYDFGSRLKAAVDAAWPIIQPAIQSLIDKFLNLMKTLVPQVISALVGLGQSIASAIGAQLALINWGELISTLWTKALDLGKRVIDGIGVGLGNLVSSVQGFLGSINLVDIQAQAGDFLRKALNFGIGVLNNIVSGLGNIASSIQTWLSSINLVDLQAQASAFLQRALNFGAGVINNIVSGLSTLANDIRTRLETAFAGVDLMAEATKLLQQALTFGEGLLNNIASGISNFANDIKAKLEAQFSGVDIGAAAKKFLDDAKKFGGDILSKIGDGLSNTYVDIAGKIADWLNGINWEQVGKDVAKGAMKIGKAIIDALFPPDTGIGDSLADSVDKASTNGKVTEAGKKLGKALVTAIGDGLKGIGEMIAGKLMEEMSKSTPDWLLGLLGTNKTALAMTGKMLQSGGTTTTTTTQPPVTTTSTQPPVTTTTPLTPGAPATGASAGVGAFVGQQAQAGPPIPVTVQPSGAPVQIDASGKPIPVDVKSITPGQNAGAQVGQQAQMTPPVQPPPTAPAGAPPVAGAGAAGGLNPMDVTLQSVQQKLQEAIQWINTVGSALLTEAMSTASTLAANAFKAGMASIPMGVILPVSLANLWVATIGTAGAVGVFGALSKSASGALTGIAGPIVAQVAEALIRIATMIAALPNGVGAQLSGQIRAAAGARAEGGPVGPGLWLVGEKGPELLMLGGGQSGQVISNKALRGGGSGSNGGGGTTIILQNPQFNGVQDPEQLLTKLQDFAGRYNLTLGTP